MYTNYFSFKISIWFLIKSTFDPIGDTMREFIIQTLSMPWWDNDRHQCRTYAIMNKNKSRNCDPVFLLHKWSLNERSTLKENIRCLRQSFKSYLILHKHLLVIYIFADLLNDFEVHRKDFNWEYKPENCQYKWHKFRISAIKCRYISMSIWSNIQLHNHTDISLWLSTMLHLSKFSFSISSQPNFWHLLTIFIVFYKLKLIIWDCFIILFYVEYAFNFCLLFCMLHNHLTL